jgi:LAT3 family solute carrier family 43 protein 3
LLFTWVNLYRYAEYIGLLLWFTVVVTPSQYYVLSIGYQLEQKGDAVGL